MNFYLLCFLTSIKDFNANFFDSLSLLWFFCEKYNNLFYIQLDIIMAIILNDGIEFMPTVHM